MLRRLGVWWCTASHWADKCELVAALGMGIAWCTCTTPPRWPASGAWWLSGADATKQAPLSGPPLDLGWQKIPLDTCSSRVCDDYQRPHESKILSHDLNFESRYDNRAGRGTVCGGQDPLLWRRARHTPPKAGQRCCTRCSAHPHTHTRRAASIPIRRLAHQEIVRSCVAHSRSGESEVVPPT